MDKKSKPVLGLKPGEIIENASKYYSEAEKHFIIKEFLSSACTKVQIWRKYTGQIEEHGQLLVWMRRLGYDNSVRVRKVTLAAKTTVLKRKNLKKESNTVLDDFENLQLTNRIKDLEKNLNDSEMKAIAYSTMIDIAEREFNIPIRKKYNTKP